MRNKYRIRFAPANQIAAPPPRAESPVASQKNDARRARKSRTGCRECKHRRVKCDETFPVCKRCHQRGSICMPGNRPQWQTELPWLTDLSLNGSCVDVLPNIDKRLIKHWLENTSRIMVVDPDINPLAIPILKHLYTSPSLVHAVQSISASHEHFFAPDDATASLQQRSQALTLFRKEIQNREAVLPSAFLTVFMLGISDPWMNGNPAEFGKEHLFGSRAILDLILSKPGGDRDPFNHFLVGAYIYWEMACAFLVDPAEQRVLNTAPMFAALQQMRHSFHPIGGYSTEIFYLLGTLGKHCRRLLDLGERDLILEATLEEQMLQWRVAIENADLVSQSEAFRKHGLIMLYRICGRQQPISTTTESDGSENGDCAANNKEGDDDSQDNQAAFELETEKMIHEYACEIMDDMPQVRPDAWHLNLTAIPILTAASELTADDQERRQSAIYRFKALYSMNRIPGNLRSIELLEEVWRLRDMGFKPSWLEIMLQKGWRLSLG